MIIKAAAVTAALAGSAMLTAPPAAHHGFWHTPTTHIAQSDTRPARLAQSGAARPGAAQSRAAQSGTAQSRAAQSRAARAPLAHAAMTRRIAPPRSPLSVMMTSDRARLGYGDTVTYQITVHNSGPTAYRDAELTQLLPATLAFGSGTGDPRRAPYQVHWTVAVAPGQDATVWMTAKVIRPAISFQAEPAGDRRTLSTTACVAPAPAGQLVACDSDFDAFAAATPAVNSTGMSSRVLLAAGVSVVVILLAGGAFWFARRRRHAVRT
jgi:uncharacterized repeat protein (TIGR01451 family)/LPXTG-motif cell wall-anchored protein